MRLVPVVGAGDRPGKTIVSEGEQHTAIRAELPSLHDEIARRVAPVAFLEGESVWSAFDYCLVSTYTFS